MVRKNVEGGKEEMGNRTWGMGKKGCEYLGRWERWEVRRSREEDATVRT